LWVKVGTVNWIGRQITINRHGVNGIFAVT
jgi:hypothetical protein